MMSLGQTDRSGLGECVDRVLGWFSGQTIAQRFRNQGCLLIRTKTSALKDKICSWI